MNTDYHRIEKAIHYIEENFRRQPELKDLARQLGLSEFHCQRLFTRWAGLSPKRFLQFLTVEHAKELLLDSRSVLDATYESGLSGPGRLHDLFVTLEGITPGEYKQQGAGLLITYGFHPTSFGECIIGVTERGVCGMSFLVDNDRRHAVKSLKSSWPFSTLREESHITQRIVDRLFGQSNRHALPPLHVFAKGTNFQIKVWEALLRIPEGNVLSYDDVAILVGKPGASRAVGNAVASNPVGYLIPCHRVIRKVGSFGEYQWGTQRKKAILAWESARTRPEAA